MALRELMELMELLEILSNQAFWVAVLRIATPLILGTLGVLLCERAGVLNLGIEGIMVAGAFTGWLAVYLGAPLWLGVLASAAGLLLGQIFMSTLVYFLGLDSALLTGGLQWPAELAVVPALSLAVSLTAALLPAWGAYRSDVLQLLQTR